MINAYITNVQGSPLLGIVDLKVIGDVITDNITPAPGLTRIVNASLAGGTINGTYTCISGDANCENILRMLGNYTCIQTKSMMAIDCGVNLAEITEVTVPDSFLLLGIGLMALAIPLHRGKPA